MVNPQTCAPDTLTLWSFLPQFLQDGDAANDYTFLTWLDGIGQQQQLIDDLCRDTPTALGWSIVLDVSRCPTYALPWLAQFVGVRFTGAQLASDRAMRIAILNKGNFNRGTPAAIAAAIQPFLSPAGYVNIIERYPDPYSFTIQIFGDLGAITYASLAQSEPTYPQVASAYPFYSDMDSSLNEETVEAAAQAAVPGGLIATIIFAS